MDVLSSRASGLRHLRWGREIVASLEAQVEVNPGLSEGEREVILREAAALKELVKALSGAVKPYRDFLERTRVGFRARQRAGRFLCEEARRGPASELEQAEETLRVHTGELERMEEEERRPRKAAVRAAIQGLHEGLSRMNERLGAHFNKMFIDALYPELSRSMAYVLDEDDEDDDATAPQ